jgi:predicted secreted hydrolase
LSDIDGRKFFHTDRLNRAGPGLAGASLKDQKYWNGNWQSKWISLGTGEQELQAISDELSFHLRLKPEKPLVIHGEDGISRKGPLPDQASHYISYTRLGAAGKLQWQNRDLDVNGLAWMDHEFFTQSADADLAGWDWFAIQLYDRFSSGTYVDQQGKPHFLDASQFAIKPLTTWHSTNSGATYPIAWNISVPAMGLQLTERTALSNQELFNPNDVSPTYWEGAVSYDGTLGGTTVRGVGYLEMTGYAGPTRGLSSP